MSATGQTSASQETPHGWRHLGRDLGRDWRSWSRGERLVVEFIALGFLAAIADLFLLMAQN